jgi:peptidoglycan/LPS O-acetylase OafA/YrhL
MTEAKHDRDRMHWLDGVRGAAALFVVLHHMWLSTWPFFPANRGPWFVGPLLYGHLAVAVFIVVSGFSLALSPLRHEGRLPGGMKRFIQRRAWRILPPYWAALTISIVLMALFLRPDLSADTLGRTYVIHGTLTQDIFGNVPPPGAFWSIAVEWQIYFFFPLILLIARLRGIAAAAIATAAFVLLGHFLAGQFSLFHKIDFVSPQFLALFGFGVLAAFIVNGRGPAIPTRVFGAVAVLAFAGTVTLHFVKGSPWMATNWFWVDLLFGTFAASGLLLLARWKSPLRDRTIGSRPAVFLGGFSYSVYLMHAQILELIHKYVVGPMDVSPLAKLALLISVGLPVILAISYGFHLVFEKPFLYRRDVASLKTLPPYRLLASRRAPVVEPVTTTG